MRIKKQYFVLIGKPIKPIIAISLLLSHTYTTYGQTNTYTLNQCYEIAIANTPRLKSRILDILSSDIAIQQAKMMFLPTLNAGATHGYNWGQSIDPFTNTFATGRVRTNNFALRSSWDIFSGLLNKYTLNSAFLGKKSAEKNYELEKRNFKNEVAAMYAKLQTDHLLFALYQEQLLLSKVVYDNVRALEKSGRRSTYDRLRVEALVQQDSAATITAKNTIRYTEFVLNQLLNENDSSKTQAKFEILSEQNLSERLHSFNDWNVDSFQEMQLSKLELEAAALQHKIFRSQLLPTLSINSAIGSGYSGRNQELIGTSLVPKPMDVQLRENFYQTAVLTLSVPIFNAYRVRNQIKLAQIQIQQASLIAEQTEIELINMLESLLLEYENEQVNMKANLRVLNTNEELFDAGEKMFLVGTINYAEFSEAKNALVQSKLNYLISLSKCYGILLILENLIG